MSASTFAARGSGAKCWNITGSGRPTPASQSVSDGQSKPHLPKANRAEARISSIESIRVPSRSNRTGARRDAEDIGVKLVFAHAYEHGGVRGTGSAAGRWKAGRDGNSQLPF